MSERYYIRIRGQVQGPYTQEHLRSLARRGQFSRFHEVSTDGASWFRAEDFPQFFATVTPTKPPYGPAPADRVSAAPGTGTPVRENPAEASPDATAAPAAAEPPPSQAGSVGNGREWYYARGDEEYGPVDLEFLKMLVYGGKLGPEDLIWKDPMPEWLPARSLVDLAPHQSQAGLTPGSGPAPQMSGMAVWSLVLGILWLGGLGSLLAIVLGVLALSQIRQSGGRLSGKPVAAAGTALGVVLLTLTAIVGVVLYFEWASAP